MARDRHPARLLQVSAPGRDRLQRGLHPGRAGRQSRDRPDAGGAVRGPPRPAPGRAGHRTRRTRRQTGSTYPSRSWPGSRPPSKQWRISTRTGSCAAISASSAPRCAPTTTSPAPTARRSPTFRSSSTRTGFPNCRSRGRNTRSSSIRRASRPCICAAAPLRAAASAGRTGARTSAPRCWGSPRPRR